MRIFLITLLALLITSCANYDFVPTPVDEEIHTITYSIESPSDTKKWRITNNDLKVRLTTKARNGQTISDNVIKTTPNDYNWVAYYLEQADFDKVKSIQARNASQRNEVLTIETQAKTYVFNQNSNSRFPAGIKTVVDAFPRLFPVR